MVAVLCFGQWIDSKKIGAIYLSCFQISSFEFTRVKYCMNGKWEGGGEPPPRWGLWYYMDRSVDDWFFVCDFVCEPPSGKIRPGPQRVKRYCVDGRGHSRGLRQHAATCHCGIEHWSLNSIIELCCHECKIASLGERRVPPSLDLNLGAGAGFVTISGACGEEWWGKRAKLKAGWRKAWKSSLQSCLMLL